MPDPMGLFLRAAGIDLGDIMAQAKALKDAFDGMYRSQVEIKSDIGEVMAMLYRVQGSLDMITSAMGLHVSPPTDDKLALIDEATARHVEQFGGLATDTGMAA
ncbi:MAG TPA: hypothetical protein VGF36_02370 [Rhodopila sp.]